MTFCQYYSQTTVERQCAYISLQVHPAGSKYGFLSNFSWRLLRCCARGTFIVAFICSKERRAIVLRFSISIEQLL